MKKLGWIFLIMVVSVAQVLAQDENPEKEEEGKDDKEMLDEENTQKKEKRSRKGEVRTISGDNYHSGGFGAISFKGTDYMGETMIMAGVRGGWIINRAVALGFEGWGIIPTAKLTDVYQFDDVIVLGGYGGFFIEPILFSNQIVHVTFPVSGGAGWMGYNLDFTDPNNGGNVGGSYLVDEDVYWYVEPGVALEVNVSRHFRMDFGASKRFTQDLEMMNTPSDAFDEWSYFMTLKFGGF